MKARTAKGAELPETASYKLEAGAELGQYRIEAKAGEGGMGAMYRVLDSRLRRTVALKVLSRQEAEGRARSRFLREAGPASKLNHANVDLQRWAEADVGSGEVERRVLAGQACGAVREAVETEPLRHFRRRPPAAPV
jgi:serine/threonine protein kinase